MSEGTETPPVAAAVAEEPMVLPAALSLFDQLALRWIAKTDKGTKFGITRAMLGDYLNRRGLATEDELAGLTIDKARDILFSRYWMPIAGDKLPEPVAALIFDVAVRRSTEEAGKLLQAALKKVEPVALKLDGRIGVQTLTAVDEIIAAGKAIALEERVMAERTTAKFRLGDGKFFGHDLDFAAAIRIAGVFGKAAIAARTGIRLP